MLKKFREIINDFDDNIYYFDRADYFKELSALTKIRNILGLRTAFNTIEKLPKLGNSDFAITGVFHKPYVQKYNEIFKGRYKRFALIQANEGSPELLSKAKLWVTDERGQISEINIDPSFYGITYEKSQEGINLDATLELLADPTDDFLKLVRLNAAVYLFVANKVKGVEEGYELLN